MRIVALCLLAVLGLGVGVASAAPVAAPVVGEPLAEKDGLRVSISAIRPVVSNEDEEKAYALRFSDTYRYIDVVLQNTSTKPIYIVSGAQGWNAVTLVISKVDGKVVEPPIIVGRPYVGWRANINSLEAIAPGEALVTEVRFTVPDPPETSGDLGRSLYRNFPSMDKNGGKITMRAVYSNGYKFELPGSQGKPLSAWTGVIASPFQEYIVPPPPN